MKRSVTTHAILLVIALIAAYLVWTRDRSTTKDDELPVLALRQVDRVVYDAPGERKVQIERKKDARGSHYYWLSVEKWERQRPKPPSRPARRPRPSLAPGAKAPMPAPKVIAKPIFKGAAKAPTPAKSLTPKKAKVAAPPKAKNAGDSAAEKSLRRDPKAAPEKAKASPKAKGAAGTKKTPPVAPAPGVKKVLPVKALPAGKGAAAPVNPKPSKWSPGKALPKLRKESHFVGNKATEELMKTLAKLPAIRALGRIGKEKLDEFGLSDAKKTLKITEGKNTRVFKVGKRTHGNMDYYLQDVSDERVYVVRPRALQDLSYAEYRLMERNLHTFDSTEFDRVQISTKEKKVALQQHNRHKPSKATYSRLGGSGKAESHFKSWMQKLSRLRALEYPTPASPLRGLVPVAKVQFYFGQKSLGVTELLVHQQGISGPADYYARSETTRVPVKVSKSIVKELERDLPALFSE